MSQDYQDLLKRLTLQVSGPSKFETVLTHLK